jgi:hypothetical protein
MIILAPQDNSLKELLTKQKNESISLKTKGAW